MADTTEAAATSDDAPLTETGLKAIIANEMENALGIDGGKLSNERRDALKQYLGEKYGNEVDGRSQVVDRTIMETVEWILPALLRLFTASDKVVNVEPQQPQDEQAAEQQTEYANYIFTRDNNGFFILHTWFKDALLQKLGWVKVYWDIERKSKIEKYQGLTQEQYDALKADEDVEVIDEVVYAAFGPALGLVHQEATRAGAQPLVPGQPLSPLRPSPANTQVPPGTPQLYDCTLKRTQNHGRVKIVPVAPEEVLVSRRAVPTYEGGTIPFVCHRRRCTRGELLEMGFDKNTVMTLAPYSEQEYNTERVQRFQKNDEWPYRSARTDAPMVEVWLNECYLHVDWDHDGIAELRKVVVAGDKSYVILSNEDADEIPLICTTPLPMPHVLFGLSMADIVGDLQLIKTTIWRQMLDNLYLANNSRMYVNEDAVTENTYDDLLTSRPGALIRGKGPYGENIAPIATPFVAEQAFPMIEYIDQQTEKRSGIAKGNQGLAPDDLNQQSQVGSMGIAMLQEQAAQRVELVGRVFAEGVKELFQRILGLVVRNQQDPRIIKLTGQWTPIDPSDWDTQFEMTTTVGLGTGNRDRMVAQLNQLLQLQAAAVQQQGGPHGPLITPQNVYHTFKQLVSSMGYKNTDDFVTDPAKAPPPPPPQPNPQVQAAQIKAQTDLQTSQQKSQLDSQNQAAELAMRERLGVLELQLKQQVAMAELELKKEQLQVETFQGAAELDLKRQDQQLKGADHELKKRTTPGAAPLKKRVTVHRDPQTQRIIGADVDELPSPVPGSLPEGPGLPA